MTFFSKNSVFVQKPWQKLIFKQSKEKLLLENRKYFVNKEKTVLKAYFLNSANKLGGPLRPPGYGPGLISVNFDNFFYQC